MTDWHRHPELSEDAAFYIDGADSADLAADPVTVCVRLDGLADKIGQAMYEDETVGPVLHGDAYPSWADLHANVRAVWTRYGTATVALLQSLAVQ